MFVECLGLPGSGKTTLIKGTEKILDKQGYRILHAAQLEELDKRHNDMPKYVQRGQASRTLYRTHSFELEYSDCAQQIRKAFRDDKTSRALILAVAVRHQIALANRKALDLILVDEGFVHRFIHILVDKHYGNATALDRFCTGIITMHRGKETALSRFCQTVIEENQTDKKMLTRFCDSMPFPEAMIYLDVPPKQSQTRALERLAARHGNTRKKVLKERIKTSYGDIDIFKRRRYLMDHAVAHLEERGCNIIRVPKSQSPEEIQNYTAGKLSRHISATIRQQRQAQQSRPQSRRTGILGVDL